MWHEVTKSDKIKKKSEKKKINNKNTNQLHNKSKNIIKSVLKKQNVGYYSFKTYTVKEIVIVL